MSALERAQQDIEAGDLGMARRRLASYLSSKGYDPEVLTKLGRVCHNMCDPYEAGRAWLASNAQGDEVERAIAIFLHRGGCKTQEVAKRLPRFVRLEQMAEYPTIARERLEQLGFDSESIRFVGVQDPVVVSSRWEKLVIGLSLAVLVIGVIFSIVGIFTFTEWLQS